MARNGMIRSGGLRGVCLALGLLPGAASAQETPELAAKVDAFLARELAAQAMPPAPDRSVWRAFADLGGTPVPEALVIVSSRWDCGTRGCAGTILDLTGPEARSIGDFIAHDFTPLESRSNGWREVDMNGALLAFDGTRYVVAIPSDQRRAMAPPAVAAPAPEPAPAGRVPEQLTGGYATLSLQFAPLEGAGGARESEAVTVAVGDGVEIPSATVLNTQGTLAQGIEVFDVAVDFGPDWVRADFRNAGSGVIQAGRFVGPAIRFHGTPPVEITQARIDAETTMAGLAPERVLFAGDSLWINTAGLAYGPDTVIRIGLTLAP
ncbi:MAG: hypothetical protein KDK03_18800 [Rhodobacteraceae bacterium]|nr:hypothetical protein [Paracoccaceae bacterium]